MLNNILDVIDVVYDELPAITADDLEKLARKPSRLAAVLRKAAKAIRNSAVEREFIDLKSEREQRLFKTLFEGQFLTLKGR